MHACMHMRMQEEPQNVTLSFGVGSVHAWMLQSQMAGVQQQQQQLGLQNEKEGFMLKRILIETNPLMLAFSALFILAHSVFSFFAFKNGTIYIHIEKKGDTCINKL